MPKVIIPPPYRGPTEGHAQADVDAATVREALNAVDERYPGFGELIFDGGGAVHRFVKLFLNGDPLPPEGLDTALAAGDVVEVLGAIAGG